MTILWNFCFFNAFYSINFTILEMFKCILLSKVYNYWDFYKYLVILRQSWKNVKSLEISRKFLRGGSTKHNWHWQPWNSKFSRTQFTALGGYSTNKVRWSTRLLSRTFIVVVFHRRVYSDALPLMVFSRVFLLADV